MVFIILFAIIGIAYGFYIGYDEMFGDLIMALLMSVLVGMLGGLFGTLVAIAFPAEMVEVTERVELVSLQDNSSVSGSFFLGSGSVEGKMVYVFYKKVGIGYKMGTLPHEDVTIVYTKSDPYIEYKTHKPTKSAKNLFGIDIPPRQSYVIYVAEGTIKSDFNLDARQ